MVLGEDTDDLEWTTIWSNVGAETIHRWRMGVSDTFYSADFSGGDEVELFVVNTNDGSASFLEYVMLPDHHVNNTLNLSIVGEGDVTIDPPDQVTYDYDEVVTLMADADQGWTFSHWGGDLSGSDNPATVVMDKDKKITAYFTDLWTG